MRPNARQSRSSLHPAQKQLLHELTVHQSRLSLRSTARLLQKEIAEAEALIAEGEREQYSSPTLPQSLAEMREALKAAYALNEVLVQLIKEEES